MKRILTILLTLILLLNIVSCGTPKETMTYVDPTVEFVMQTDFGIAPVNQVEILMKEGTGKEEAQAVAIEIGAEIVGEIPYIQLYQLQTQGKTPEDLVNLVAQAAANPNVASAGPNQMATEETTIKGTPLSKLSDPLYKEGTNGVSYEMIKLENAWKILSSSGTELSNVKVGVADFALYTGSDETGASNFEGDTTEEQNKDANGNIKDGGYNHGTMVSHVIAANGENGGVSGVASNLGKKLTIRNANIYTGPDYVQVATDPNDPNDITKIIRGGTTYMHTTLVNLKKLADEGCKVINCSFGGYHSRSDTMSKDAYTRFFAQMSKDYPDVVFVASAGNGANKEKTEGHVKHHWPGGISSPNVITVGALNPDGTRANFSNFQDEGGEVTISACGVDVPTAVDKDGKTITADGTSLSTPQVTGAIAILKSINPKLTSAQIKALITSTASKGTTNANQSVPIPEGMGAGVLNLEEVVLKAINDKRIEEGKEPFLKETLMAMNQVDLTAIGGPLDYKIEARVDAVGDAGTDITIDVSGDNALSGKLSQHVDKDVSANWSITIPKPGNYLKVTRSDTGAGSWLNLIGDLSGKWTGTLTIENVPPKPETSSSCGEIDFAQMIGQQLPLTINLEPADENGLVYKGTGRFGESELLPIRLTLNGTEAELTAIIDETASFTLVGTLNSDEAKDSILGQWNFSTEGIIFGGSGTMSKPVVQ